ncbi:MAG: hypothetical protein JXR96_16985 [Deltaproteobacteria bacterium]|nr:hypothetical protein [Deltaproteobacteria bacterium]
MRAGAVTTAALALALLGQTCSRAVVRPGGAGSSVADAGSASHFVDSAGAPLPQWSFIWERLHAYYGASTPETITVVLKGSGASHGFHPPSRSIFLAPGADAEVVAHESTHLCNFELTRGASNTLPFRFIDEGLANIMASRIAGDGGGYKACALAAARQESLKGELSLARVQDWRVYFGDPKRRPSALNRRAYEVGASFVFMLEDTRGSDALRAFLMDIGRTRDIEKTSQSVFSSTAKRLEEDWLRYLERVEVDASTPAVIEMSPPDRAAEVPLGLGEIWVTFSTPMYPRICVTTPCGDTGVCYTNAAWKPGNRLVIQVDGSLKPGHSYDLLLGSERGGCHLTSCAGAALPFVRWRFTTADR